MGGRHPFYCKYRAGFTKEGKYTGLDILYVNDGGSTFDCTSSVLDKAIFQSQTCYTIPNMRVEGRAARTNRVTNTAFRGFGVPQATFFQETIMDHFAQLWFQRYNDGQFRTFGEAAHHLRMLNLNRPGDLMLTQTLVSTKYAEHLTQTLLQTLLKRAGIEQQFARANEFNAKHKYVKRGVAVTPLKNSVNFEENFLN